MTNSINQSQYPDTFREQDTKVLAQHIQKSNSVEIIGLKRVGISNFLKFFYSNNSIKKKYFDKNHHLFIYIDLNNLVERELLAFWRLTLKRIIDSIDELESFPTETIATIKKLFQDSIQTHDIFLTLDAIRQILIDLCNLGIIPTIFFVRFDRLNGTYTADFYNNLKAMVDACNHKLNFIFTTYRPLEEINPDKKNSSFFTHRFYLKTAKPKDTKLIYEIFNQRFNLEIDQKQATKIQDFAAGHINYLHLLLVELLENRNQNIREISKSERIFAQTEELLTYFTNVEKEVIKKILKGDKLSIVEKDSASYLWDIGFLNQKNELFSKLVKDNLVELIKKQDATNQNSTLTKKEHLLFTLLKTNLEKICTREQIVTYVWPECSEYGVTDWTIDRLTSRLRKKLKASSSEYKIKTIRTRGFQMTKI